jgi:hypothetical protein
MILDESLFHVAKNAPNEHSGINLLERRLETHPLLENPKRTKVKALKDIGGMRGESDNLDSVGGKFF